MISRRARVLIGTVAVVMVGMVACSDDDDGNTNNNNGNSNNNNENSNQNQNNNNQLDPITPGGCGLSAYDWLPTTHMGTLVSYEEDPLSPVTAEDVEGVLAGLNSALVPVAYGMRLYRIRYITQDKGQQVEATAMVGIPWNEADGPVALPVALWHHGTTGFTSPCAPSALGLSEIAKVGIFTAHGYITAAPDYIGLDGASNAPVPPTVKHAYLGIEQTGIGSLDALRATYHLLNDELGLKVTANSDVVLWGASQGGHGAFATNLIAPYYAPEFDIRALVASVPASDLTGQIAYSLSADNVATPYAAAAMVTMHTWYEGTAPFSDVLTDDASTFFASQWTDTVFTSCGAMSLPEDATELERLFTADALQGAAGTSNTAWEPWECYFSENSIATSPIPRNVDTPTLFITGEVDTLVDIVTARADYDRLCGLGYRMEYLECTGADHMDAALWSLVDQIAWVKDRLDGVPLEESDVCVRTSAQTCTGTE